MFLFETNATTEWKRIQCQQMRVFRVPTHHCTHKTIKQNRIGTIESNSPKKLNNTLTTCERTMNIYEYHNRTGAMAEDI